MLLIEVIIEKDYDLVLHYVIGILYSRGSSEWMPCCSPLWFLTALSVASFAFNLIMSIECQWIRFLFVFLCSGLAYLLNLFKIPKLIWNIDTALMAVAFIYIGYMASGEKERLFEKKKHASVTLCLLVFGTFCIYINKRVDFNNNEYGNFVLMMLGAILVSYVLSYFVHYVHPLTEAVAFFGKHTIFIMGFDYFSGKIGMRLTNSVGVYNWLTVFLTKILILIVGLTLWYFVIGLIRNDKINKLLRY